MLSVSDTVTNSQQNWSEQRTWGYSYDDFNRLSAANESDNITGQANYSYAYDRFGNRWQQNGPSSMMLSFSGNNNRIDAANGVSYDAVGNVIGYHPPAGDTFSYAYDAENRLTSVTDQTTGNQTCYTYDANGQRVERTYNCGTNNSYSRDFIYDLGGHQISQVEGSNVWDHGDVYAGGQLLATYVWDGTMYFNYPDQLGSSRERVDITGAGHEGCTSLPFGELTCSGDDPSPMHFTGQEHDFESGLDNFKARHYDSGFGRFMSPDPTGIFLGDLNDPQQLNLYAYVRGNPINRVDPMGTDDPGTVETEEHDDSWWHLLGSPGQQLANVRSGNNFNGGSLSSPFGFQFTDDNGVPYPGLFNSWEEYAGWRTSLPGLSEQLNNLINGFYNDRDYVQTGLEQAGAPQGLIDAFLAANPNRFSAILQGGNYNFVDPEGQIKAFITASGDCAHARCDNGLDFSHESLGFQYFHRDTADPFNIPGGTLLHLKDIIYGNFVDVIPR